jgi:hypothetical protein
MLSTIPSRYVGSSLRPRKDVTYGPAHGIPLTLHLSALLIEIVVAIRPIKFLSTSPCNTLRRLGLRSGVDTNIGAVIDCLRASSAVRESSKELNFHNDIAPA